MSDERARGRELARTLVRRLTALDPSARRLAAERILSAWPPGETMLALSALLEAREAGDGRAREALAVVVAAISELGVRDEVSDLLAYARAHHEPVIARLLERPQAARDFRPEEELSVDREMRELTLGYRRQLARTATRQELLRLMGDPDPVVVRNLLTHPKITENDVVRLAARRPARPEVLREVFRSPRWSTRRRVRRALANNPYTPTEIALKLVVLLPLTDARELAADVSLHESVRLAAASRVADDQRRREKMKAASRLAESEPEGEA